MFKFPRIQAEVCSKDFLGNKSNINKKKTFLGKATSHNDHYMINMMGGQRSKIGGD